jgi:Anthrone oxygenase
MKKIVLFFSITFMAGVTFTNIYNSIVDAKIWGSNIPNSVAATRQYFQYGNPGNFFRIFSPVNQILALLTLILFWKTSKKIRIFFALAFAIAVGTDVLTFSYFYPRNDLLMTVPIQNISRLTEIISGWQFMNWIRSGVLTAGVIFLFTGMNKFYALPKSQKDRIQNND